MSNPWLKFWVGDWRSSSRIRRLTMVERGHFLELILADHEGDGLPGDWDTLRLELPVQSDRDITLRVLQDFFVEGEDGLWRNPKRVHHEDLASKRADAGRKGAGKRYGKPPSICHGKPDSKQSTVSHGPEREREPEEREQKEERDEAPSAYTEWRCWPQHMHEPAAPDDSFRALFSENLNQHSAEQIIEAVNMAHKLPFYLGENDKQETFLHWRYLLRPGEIARILGHRDIKPDNDKEDAAVAWAPVRTWLRDRGAVGHPKWTDFFPEKTLQAVERIGGLRALIEMDSFQLERARGDFERAYRRAK